MEHYAYIIISLWKREDSNADNAKQFTSKVQLQIFCDCIRKYLHYSVQLVANMYISLLGIINGIHPPDVDSFTVKTSSLVLILTWRDYLPASTIFRHLLSDQKLNLSVLSLYPCDSQSFHI